MAALDEIPTDLVSLRVLAGRFPMTAKRMAEMGAAGTFARVWTLDGKRYASESEVVRWFRECNETVVEGRRRIVTDAIKGSHVRR